MYCRSDITRPQTEAICLSLACCLILSGCGLFTSGSVSSTPPQEVLPPELSELTNVAERATGTADSQKGGNTHLTKIGGLSFVRVSAGSFQMGAEPGDQRTSFNQGEFPRHPVSVTRPFLIGKFEVTVDQFRHFVEATGYVSKVEREGKGANSLDRETGGIQQHPETTWRSPGFHQTGEHPVVCVAWEDTIAFCEWMSARHAIRIRLPTEAEWEFACRSGTQSRFAFGDRPQSLHAAANIRDQSFVSLLPNASAIAPWSDGAVRTAAVGSFRPNAFGIHDMHGNVGEWCSDWYDADYYSHGRAVDPVGPSAPTSWRSVRGGSWFNGAESCRCSGRHDGIETAPSTTNGFRVVAEIVE